MANSCSSPMKTPRRPALSTSPAAGLWALSRWVANLRAWNGRLMARCVRDVGRGQRSVCYRSDKGQRRGAGQDVATPANDWLSPDGSRAYVTSDTGNAVDVLDTRDHRVLTTIKLTHDMLRPMGVAVAPDGSRIYVTLGRGKNVAIIDTKTNALVSMIEVGDRPWGIAISPDGRRLYTANGPSTCRLWTSQRKASLLASRPGIARGAPSSAPDVRRPSGDQNTEVKLSTADGTAWETAWESRSLPGLFFLQSAGS